EAGVLVVGPRRGDAVPRRGLHTVKSASCPHLRVDTVGDVERTQEAVHAFMGESPTVLVCAFENQRLAVITKLGGGHLGQVAGVESSLERRLSRFSVGRARAAGD